MPTLASIDWLVFLLYLFCVAAIGLSMRSNIKSAGEFLQAERALPAWVCMLAFSAASAGSVEVIAAGAAGAEYGFGTSLFLLLGAIVALLFVARFMMPLYYDSGARTLPEYLGMRFGSRVRLLSACLFIVMALVSGGIALALVARLFEALRIFEPLFYAYGLPREAIFSFCVVLFAVVVFVYVLFGGLAAAMVNQALQFTLLVAGFLPLVWKGLDEIGGWSGLQSSFATASAAGVARASGSGAALAALALGLGFGLARWTTDFRVLQTAMAGKSADAARRISQVAALLLLFVSALIVLPGAIAIGLPTPQSKTVVHSENGAIYHEITVVPKAIAEGHGLVPARLDPASQSPMHDAAGHPLLDYSMATSEMMVHWLPAGLLGLGVTALLAALMSGAAASVTAVNAVFTWDIYPVATRGGADEQRSIAVARLTTFCGVTLIAAAAFGFRGSGWKGGLGPDFLAAALIVFSVLQVPQLATYLLGAFTRRISGTGAFAGLAAGTAAALLHQGLTMPAGFQRGLCGGWIAVLHQYPNCVAQCVATAVAGLAVNAIVALLFRVEAQH